MGPLQVQRFGEFPRRHRGRAEVAHLAGLDEIVQGLKGFFQRCGVVVAVDLVQVRIVHHYGGRPEFVLLGGLVPALLCAQPQWRHAGTGDVDVQVNLEIAGGAVQAARLEKALRNAEFEPDSKRVWRWKFDDGVQATIKFELLADLPDKPNNETVVFTDCDALGAANLRGTGYALRDNMTQTIRANDHGTLREVEITVTALAGFLLAKVAAARGRRKPKDWYDIAYVLLHNDQGDAIAAAERVLHVFGLLTGDIRTQLQDLQANFADEFAQGTEAYVRQITVDHPELGANVAAADAQLAVAAFTQKLLS